MTVVVTGAAGFIGYHVARRLAGRGARVVGVDNLNDFYDTELKRRRLAELAGLPGFQFRRVELSDRRALADALAGERVRRVIHLAAQANVRYGLENPHAYVESNVAGHLNVLEFCRHADGLESLVYASSSSVYGGGSKIPFREDGVTDRPNSLYAATKKSQEMMSAVYADIFGIPQTGLRFFSVYGPWGRPDMAYWLFTDAILKGRPVRLFNRGDMSRDFTYIDDVVTGVIAASDAAGEKPGHRIYNIGNSRPVVLLDMVRILERLLGEEARLELLPPQPGEVPATYADISAIEAALGFRPATSLEEGLHHFVDWFRAYHGLG
ncbi:MAG TPA: NAD-dependent epimerase/dehydratase family protein [Propylenella sp.]